MEILTIVVIVVLLDAEEMTRVAAAAAAGDEWPHDVVVVQKPELQPPLSWMIEQ